MAYTQEQLRDALRKAASAGDNNAANEIAAVLDARQPPTQDAIRGQIWDESSNLDKVAIGAGETVEQVLQGIGLGTTSAEDLRLSQQQESPYKTGGKIAADIGMLLVPASRIAKAATAIPKAGRLAKTLAAIGGESALVGGYEGAKLPGEGESRSTNAALGGGLTALGGVAIPALGGLARAAGRQMAGPMKEGARELIDAGVKLTPGQAYAAPWVGNLENALTYIPGLAGGTRKLQQESLDTWNKYVLQQVHPFAKELDQLNLLGPTGFKQLQEDFGKAYGRVWKPVTKENFNPQLTHDTVVRKLDQLDELTPDARPVAKKVLYKVADELEMYQKTGNVQFLEKIDDALRDAGNAMSGVDYDWMKTVRDGFRRTLPKTTRDSLTQVDTAYRKYAVAQRAGSYKDALATGRFTPSQLLGAVKAKNAERALSRGEGAMQDVAQQGMDTVGDLVPKNSTMQKVAAGGGVPAIAAGVAMGGGAPLLAAAAGGRAAVTPLMRDIMTGGGDALARARAGLGLAGAAGVGTGLGGGSDANQRALERLRRQAELMRRGGR